MAKVAGRWSIFGRARGGAASGPTAGPRLWAMLTAASHNHRIFTLSSPFIHALLTPPLPSPVLTTVAAHPQPILTPSSPHPHRPAVILTRPRRGQARDLGSAAPASPILPHTTKADPFLLLRSAAGPVLSSCAVQSAPRQGRAHVRNRACRHLREPAFMPGPPIHASLLSLEAQHTTLY